MRSSQIVPTGDSILCTGTRHGDVVRCKAVVVTSGRDPELQAWLDQHQGRVGSDTPIVKVGDEFIVHRDNAYRVDVMDAYDRQADFYLTHAVYILATITPVTET